MKYIFPLLCLLSTGLGFHKLQEHAAGKPEINIVCDGNSLTYGQGVQAELFSYPARLDSLLKRDRSKIYKVRNIGINGQITLEMIADMDIQLDSLFHPVAERNILIAWEIRNHLVRNCAGRKQALNSYIRYCHKALNMGFEVYAVTILPSYTRKYCNDTSAAGMDLLERQRLYINHYIRKNYHSFSSGLIDLAAVPEIGNSPSNLPSGYIFSSTQPEPSEYYVDGTHLNVAGYSLVAREVCRILFPELSSGR